MGLPLDKPKLCRCCGREYRSIPSTAVESAEGHVFFTCVCLSTLMVPSRRYRQLREIVQTAALLDPGGEPLSLAVRDAMDRLGLDWDGEDTTESL